MGMGLIQEFRDLGIEELRDLGIEGILSLLIYSNIENLVLPPGCRPYSPTRRARVYEPEAGPEAGPGQR